MLTLEQAHLPFKVRKSEAHGLKPTQLVPGYADSTKQNAVSGPGVGEVPLSTELTKCLVHAANLGEGRNFRDLSIPPTP